MSETPVHKGAHLADPGPLGLAAFATTTFVLSLINTGTFKVEPVVFGLAFAFGGGAQILAGMWEFAKGNTFGATAFTAYGAFWLSFWYLATHLAGQIDPTAKLAASDIDKSVGLFLLAWTIFTAYMLVASLGTGNPALMAVFVLLTLAFLFLTLGKFGSDLPGDGMTNIGGWLGVLTAIAAWYTSFAGVTASTLGRPVLPTGAK